MRLGIYSASAAIIFALVAGSASSQPVTGLASYYKHGHRTASGEPFNPHAFTAAHRSLPFGTQLRVTNVRTGQSVIVRVNDRGPSSRSRVIDVSYGAAQALGMVRSGVARISYDVLR